MRGNKKEPTSNERVTLAHLFGRWCVTGVRGGIIGEHEYRATRVQCPHELASLASSFFCSDLHPSLHPSPSIAPPTLLPPLFTIPTPSPRLRGRERRTSLNLDLLPLLHPWPCPLVNPSKPEAFVPAVYLRFR